ncbi:MAG: GGDEF domain-containing protein [Spirochaetales bacterium]|nr:GGDEF domain-containing protein [Spirochaetales bacterium]
MKMKDKYLLIINDCLDRFSPLLERIKERAPYYTDIISFSTFLAGSNKQQLDNAGPSDIFIAIEGNFFEENEEKLRAYFKSIDKATFNNFLYLFTEPRCAEDPAFMNGNKPCYLFFEKADNLTQAIQFNLFMVILFDKAMLSYRLSDYIKHAFMEVVYSEMLKKQKDDIEELNKELARKNKIDNLTNLYNRRALFEFLEKERNRTIRNLQRLGGGSDVLMDYKGRQERKKRKKKEDKAVVYHQSGEAEKAVVEDEPSVRENFDEEIADHFGIFSIMMIDLDHFKRVNDTYGHLVGDRVLKTVGDLLQRKGILRDHDIPGRFGGEEFIVILPNTNAYNALGPAIRLAQELNKIEFKTDDGRAFKVTLSIGVSEYHPTDKDNEAIIFRADRAMYYAKQNGRNQIIIYEKIFGQGNDI